MKTIGRTLRNIVEVILVIAGSMVGCGGQGGPQDPVPRVFAFGEIADGDLRRTVVLRSEDLGDTWRIVGDRDFEHPMDLRFFDRAEAVALSGAPLLRTGDAGETWTEEGRAPDTAPYKTHAGGLFFTREDAALFGSSYRQSRPNCSTTFPEVVSTADFGLSWNISSIEGAGALDVSTGCVAGDSNAILLAYERLSPPCVGAAGLLTTRDRGRTWILAAEHGYGSYPPRAVSCTKDGAFWVVGDGSLWQSPDGGATWADASAHLPDGIVMTRELSFIDRAT